MNYKWHLRGFKIWKQPWIARSVSRHMYPRSILLSKTYLPQPTFLSYTEGNSALIQFFSDYVAVKSVLSHESSITLFCLPLKPGCLIFQLFLSLWIGNCSFLTKNYLLILGCMRVILTGWTIKQESIFSY